MSRPSLYVNDFDLEQIGFTAEEVLGLDDAPDLTLPVAGVGGLAGAIIMATREAKVEARQISVTGHLMRSSTALLGAALTQLKGLLSAGMVELRSVRNANRVAVGYFVGSVETPYKVMYRRVQTKLTLRFLCPDPWLYDRSALTVGPITTGPVACPLGTAPVKPHLYLFAPGASGSITYRDAAGIARGVMGFTFSPSLGANDFLDIDCDSGTIQKSVGGSPTVVSNAYDTWTTKADGLLTLDPLDGDTVNGVYPTFEASAGTLLAVYPRAYR